MRLALVALLILCGSCQTASPVAGPTKAGWSNPRFVIPGHPQRLLLEDI